MLVGSDVDESCVWSVCSELASYRVFVGGDDQLFGRAVSGCVGERGRDAMAKLRIEMLEWFVEQREWQLRARRVRWLARHWPAR